MPPFLQPFSTGGFYPVEAFESVQDVLQIRLPAFDTTKQVPLSWYDQHPLAERLVRRQHGGAHSTIDPSHFSYAMVHLTNEPQALTVRLQNGSATTALFAFILKKRKNTTHDAWQLVFSRPLRAEEGATVGHHSDYRIAPFNMPPDIHHEYTLVLAMAMARSLHNSPTASSRSNPQP
jgi:hypothetical protein